MNLFTVPDTDDNHEKLRIAHGVDRSIPTRADTIPAFLSGQFFIPWRPGIVAERPDLRDNSLPVLLLANSFDLPGR